MARQFLKEELILLQYSKIIHEYPVLKKIITERPDLDKSEVPYLPDEEKRYFTTSEYQRIMGAAELEWHSADFSQDPPINVRESDEFDRCELCGNTLCDTLYPALNYNESKKLYVGSSCINRFLNNLSTKVNDAEKRRKLVLKYSRLVDYFPGTVEKFISTSMSCAENRAYLVVNPLYSQCKTCFQNIRDLCNKHQAADEDELPEINQQIKEALDKYAQLEEKTNEYLIKAANDPRIPDNNVVNDLRARKKGNIITMIRNKGGITSSTIRYIADLDFLTKNYLPIIKRITAGLSIHINRLDERNSAVGYLATTSSNNTVFLPHYTFAGEFGENIIQGRRIEREKTLLKSCRLCAETDVYDFIEQNARRLSFYKITPIAIRDDTEEIYFSLDSENVYSRVSIRETINDNMAFFINSGIANPDTLCQVVRLKDHMITKEAWAEIKNDHNNELEYFQ